MKSARLAAMIAGWSCLLVSAAGGNASSYYQSSAGTITFIKPAFADPKNPANWDMISPSVAITRGVNQGIYNPLVEPGYQGFSPVGTLWCFNATVQDVIDGDLTLENFQEWVFAAGQNPPGTVGDNAVVYLIAEDAFVDIRFTQWGVGNGGGGSFRYVRAIVPPPPPECPGDVTGAGGDPDGQVDVDDLNAILAVWDTTVGVGSPLDLAGDDGIVDVNDLNVVLSNWLGCE